MNEAKWKSNPTFIKREMSEKRINQGKSKTVKLVAGRRSLSTDFVYRRKEIE